MLLHKSLNEGNNGLDFILNFGLVINYPVFLYSWGDDWGSPFVIGESHHSYLAELRLPRLRLTYLLVIVYLTIVSKNKSKTFKVNQLKKRGKLKLQLSNNPLLGYDNLY